MKTWFKLNSLSITFVLTFHLVLLKIAESALRRSSSSSNSCFTCNINLHMVASLLALIMQLRPLASSTRFFQTVPLLYNVVAFPTIQRQCLHQIKQPPGLYILVIHTINNNKPKNWCAPCSSKSNICSLVISKKSKTSSLIGPDS